MAVNADEDTEFNDALRKYGILPPRPATPRTPSPPVSPSLDALLDQLSAEELNELGEDARDDELARTADALRRRRLAEQRAADKRARFGSVIPISRDEYTREVTDASKIDEEDDVEGRGTGVVCFLYKDGLPRSERTASHIRNLASRYPRTKFVAIVGERCIPGLPDSRVPMLITYRRGEILNQVIAWGADKDRRIEELEALLLLCGALDPPDRLPDSADSDRRIDSDDEDEDDPDPSSRMRSATTATNGRSMKNLRSSRSTRKNDSDSEFEFDI